MPHVIRVRKDIIDQRPIRVYQGWVRRNTNLVALLLLLSVLFVEIMSLSLENDGIIRVE